MNLFVPIEVDGKKKFFLSDERIVDFLPANEMFATYSDSNFSDDIEYLKFWNIQKTLSEYIPDEFVEPYKEFQERWKHFLESFVFSKVKFVESVFDHIPISLRDDFCFFKIKMMQTLLEQEQKPTNYDLLKRIEILIRSFEKRKIVVGGEKKSLLFSQRTKTGRLKTVKPGFPILNIGKEDRIKITPRNDEFCVFDINGADIRSVIYLLGKEQPNEDIHEFHKKEFGFDSREDAKKSFFSWLYGGENNVCAFDNIYSKSELLEKYFDGYSVTNPSGRKIETDRFHAINHLVQSTSNDCFFESVWNVFLFLKDKKTFISFCHHDSVIIDLSYSEVDYLGKIAKILKSNPMFGQIKLNLAYGKSLGELVHV